MLTIWFVLLAPWLPFALMGTGMAFEGGKTIDAYYFLFMIWTYPVLLGVAYFFRRRQPRLVWLPALTILLALFEQVVYRATTSN